MGQQQAGGTAARRLALELVQGVCQERLTLTEMEAHPHFTEAPSEVRARAGRLARTTLRLSGRADAALIPWLKRPPKPEIRAVLRLATVELLADGAAPHGVVNAAVALAREERASMAPMVNAVLRRVAEDGQAAWAAAQPQRLPNWLRGRLGSAYGNARVARMEAAFEAAAPLDITAKHANADLAETLGGTLLPTGSIRLERGGQVSALPGFEAGDWWVQDAAAALPARVLAPKPNMRVLDLCAAPGGKTLQLAKAGAAVTALDSSPTRLERLHENLGRTNLSAEVVVADALDWTAPAPFEAILLDAPCTATGTIRRHPDLPFVKDASDIRPLVELQAALADRAVQMLAPGGRLVFCTCSLLPDEGEAQIKSLLERHADLSPDDSATAGLPGVEDTWRAGPGALRTTPEMWPERGGLDGFFIASLCKA